MRRYLQAGCFLCVLALATQAHADDARSAEALARFNEGLALADSGKLDEARLKFLQSISVFKAASTLYNLASVEVKLGHDLDAIEHFRSFLQAAETDPRITDQQRERAKRSIEDLLKKVGQIDIRVPQGATLSIDGKSLQSIPTEPVPVTPGRHTVVASWNAAARTIVVEPHAGEVAKATFDAPEGNPFTPPPAEGERSSWSTARIVTVSTLAAAAITGGVLSLVFRSNAQDNVDDAKARLQGRSCVGITGPNCAAARELMDERDTNLTLSTVSLIVGGAALVGAATATFIYWPRSNDRGTSARLVPLGSVGYGGVSVVGRF